LGFLEQLNLLFLVSLPTANPGKEKLPGKSKKN